MLNVNNIKYQLNKLKIYFVNVTISQKFDKNIHLIPLKKEKIVCDFELGGK